jgi:uncharacterized protein (DUF111 family)
MKTFRARAVVASDGRMTLQTSLPPGEVEVVVTLPEPAPSSPTAPEQDTVVVLETNIDDMNPEVYGYLIDRLLASGAKDAYLTPIIMKKGRPGVMVSVLADPADTERIARLLTEETTTLGVRISHAGRYKLRRSAGAADTAFGPVRMKVAERNDRRRAAPEYDDCARIALEQGVPILEVYAAAQRAWEERSESGKQ